MTNNNQKISYTWLHNIKFYIINWDKLINFTFALNEMEIWLLCRCIIRIRKMISRNIICFSIHNIQYIIRNFELVNLLIFRRSLRDNYDFGRTIITLTQTTKVTRYLRWKKCHPSWHEISWEDGVFDQIPADPDGDGVKSERLFENGSGVRRVPQDGRVHRVISSGQQPACFVSQPLLDVQVLAQVPAHEGWRVGCLQSSSWI